MRTDRARTGCGGLPRMEVNTFLFSGREPQTSQAPASRDCTTHESSSSGWLATAETSAWAPIRGSRNTARTQTDVLGASTVDAT